MDDPVGTIWTVLLLKASLKALKPALWGYLFISQPHLLSVATYCQEFY